MITFQVHGLEIGQVLILPLVSLQWPILEMIILLPVLVTQQLTRTIDLLHVLPPVISNLTPMILRINGM